MRTYMACEIAWKIYNLRARRIYSIISLVLGTVFGSLVIVVRSVSNGIAALIFAIGFWAF